MNRNMNGNAFSYTYSAPENQEVLSIRKKYLPREETKLEELKRLDLESVKAELYSPEKLSEIREKQEHFTQQRAKALADLGLTERDLLPKWYCPKCSDTGFLKNGKPCDCFKA